MKNRAFLSMGKKSSVYLGSVSLPESISERQLVDIFLHENYQLLVGCGGCRS